MIRVNQETGDLYEDGTDEYGNQTTYTSGGSSGSPLVDTGAWERLLKNLGLSGANVGTLASGLGLAGLLGRTFGGDSPDLGYKGSIPNLVASRQMLPIPPSTTNYAPPTTPTAYTPAIMPVGGNAVPSTAMAPRRPGSGGVTYFTPMTYAPASSVAGTTATDATVPGSTGLTPPGTIAPVNDVGPGGYAKGGLAALGYAKGRLLDGPGDGVSDSIPATIDGSQPAALADGEYVIPARIVSELGNGSTKAGAQKLDAMMKRIQASRRKATNIAANTRVDKHLPA